MLRMTYLRFGVSQQVSRQRKALDEELQRANEDLLRQTDSINKLSREKEELTKEKANLVVQVTACERENRTLSEEIAGLRYVFTSILKYHSTISRLQYMVSSVREMMISLLQLNFGDSDDADCHFRHHSRDDEVSN